MTFLPVSKVSSVAEYELFLATGAAFVAEIVSVTMASLELPVPSEIR